MLHLKEAINERNDSFTKVHSEDDSNVARKKSFDTQVFKKGRPRDSCEGNDNSDSA